MVPDDRLGPYVQIAHKLRFTKDAPPRVDRLAERPRKGSKARGWGEFLDDPDAAYGAEPGPTLLEFDADDAVDVDALLVSGAIRVARADQVPTGEPVIVTETQAAAGVSATGEEVDDGKTAGA